MGFWMIRDSIQINLSQYLLIIRDDVLSPISIEINHPSKQIYINNLCLNASCSHLCLLSPYSVKGINSYQLWTKSETLSPEISQIHSFPFCYCSFKNFERKTPFVIMTKRTSYLLCENGRKACGAISITTTQDYFSWDFLKCLLTCLWNSGSYSQINNH